MWRISRPFRTLSLSLAALLALTLLLAAHPARAEVRITEVLADPLGTNDGNQKVEITNLGGASVDIGGWRICSQLKYATFHSPLTLDPDEILVVHVRANGTNDDNNFYTVTSNPLFAELIPSDDSFGLYGPTGSFADPAAMRDFVQWGAGGQARENVAVSAGLWSAGDFVAVPGEGQSIELCDAGGGSSAAWRAASPTIGVLNNCLASHPNVILSEVLVDPVGPNSGNQLIEIQNLESGAVDLSGWQICYQFAYWGLPPSTTLGAGDFLVVHVNASGTDDAQNVYTGTFLDMTASDALSLYANADDFDDAANIVDFVQWGAGGQAREDLAVIAGLWTAGQFLPASTEGRSIERCNPAPGASSWSETPGLTLGASNGCNPVDVPANLILANKVGRPTPNPTLGRTTLSFELSGAARVSARVFDARGRVVADLGEQRYPAGASSLVWSGAGSDGRRLPPGTYWIQLGSREVVGADGSPWSVSARVVHLGSGG
jgi:hypothetical protein